MAEARGTDFQESTAPVRLLVGDNRLALCGDLGGIQGHQHASPAVVVGIDGPLRFVGARTYTSRAALIAPGFCHAVDVAQGSIAVFLLPPRWRQEAAAPVRDLPSPRAWIHLGEAVRRGELTDFDSIDRSLERAQLRAQRLDDRLDFVLSLLAQTLDDNLPIEALADEVRLSPTRLMTLAREQLGTPLRTYRSWLRAFRVARDYAAGRSLTRAALDAGFSSSAHLSAAARQHFGIRPSQVLRPQSRPAIRALAPLDMEGELPVRHHPLSVVPGGRRFAGAGASLYRRAVDLLTAMRLFTRDTRYDSLILGDDITQKQRQGALTFAPYGAEQPLGVDRRDRLTLG